MADQPTGDDDEGALRLPPRRVPPPAALGEVARAALTAGYRAAGPAPDLADKDAWRRHVAEHDAMWVAERAPVLAKLKVDFVSRLMGGTPVQVATPRNERLLSARHVLLEIHGGSLVHGGGETNVRFTTAAMALRTGRVAFGVDYRMPPDHPYPAPLDDCLAAYRALLDERDPQEIVLCGASAGGNLCAALLLRCADEGLPTPAGVILLTPEIDLTESGDSFATLAGLDSVLTAPLMPANLLYADGADLAHPYLSPLFGDVSRFPPTWLQAGTRDLFLSNTVRLHRKLRAAGVRAELHVWDGMPHGGFGGLAPEDREVALEMRLFLDSLA